MDFAKLSEVLGRTLGDGVQEESERRCSEVASELGLDPSEISAGLMGLAHNMADKGVIVDLSISQCRFEQGLTPEDVGIAVDGEVPDDFKDYLETLYLGKRTLVTRKYQGLLKDLTNLEQRARNILARKSFPIRLGFGRDVLRFVPLGSYHELRDELNIIAADFESKIEDLASRLPEIRHETRVVLGSAAHEVYRMLRQSSNIGDVRPSEFREKFVLTAMNAFPTEDAVRAASFNVRTMLVPFSVPATSSVDMDILDDIKRSIVDEGNAFVQSVIGHLHGTVYDVVVSASACLKKHGTLLGPNVRALRESFSAFDALNHVVGDKALAEQLAVLQTYVDDAGARDMGNIALHLNKLREQTSEVLSTLGQAPRMKRGEDSEPLNVEAFEDYSQRGRRVRADDMEIFPKARVDVCRKRRSGLSFDGQMQIV